MMSRFDRLLARFASPEVLTFLAVGGVGYVVDVVSFNVLRSEPWLGRADPSYARVLAVALAMVVTYFGNRLFTWRGQGRDDRRREVSLFVLFNLVGLGISLASLVVSHHLLGLTSRLADNISANVIGLVLGTLFRYWSYQRFVFTGASPNADLRIYSRQGEHDEVQTSRPLGASSRGGVP
jgi:putative flippase GtrA